MPTSRKTKRPAATTKAKPVAKKVESKPVAKSTAAAATVKKTPKKPAPMPEWVFEMRDALLRRRGQMQNVVRSNRDQLAESRKNYADIGDRASEGFEDELAAGLLSIESAQLDEIEEALARIDAGTYGSCIDCDKPIPKKRLEILPFAKRCLGCEGNKERTARTYSPTDDDEDGDAE